MQRLIAWQHAVVMALVASLLHVHVGPGEAVGPTKLCPHCGPIDFPYTRTTCPYCGRELEAANAMSIRDEIQRNCDRDELVRARKAERESASVATYWRNVAKLQAAELEQVNAAWLVLSAEVQRFAAREMILQLEIAALRQRLEIP